MGTTGGCTLTLLMGLSFGIESCRLRRIHTQCRLQWDTQATAVGGDSLLNSRALRRVMMIIGLLQLLAIPLYGAEIGTLDVITVKTTWRPGALGDSQGLLIGGLAPEPEGEASLLSLNLAPEPAGWIPVWFVTLKSDLGRLREAGSERETPIAKLGPLSLSPDTEYETVMSYNAAIGQVSIAIRDAAGKVLYKGAWDTGVYTGPMYAVGTPAVSAKHFSWYEPVEVNWELGTTATGGFIPASTFDPGTPISIRVSTATQGTGQFRLAADNKELVTFAAQQGEIVIPLPSNALGLGSTPVSLQYIENGQVQFATSQTVVVGSLRASLGSVRIDQKEGLLRATVQMRSDSFLHGLQMELSGELSAMVWDDRRQAYVPKPHGVLDTLRNDLRNTMFIQPGTTNVPVTLALPEEPGLWSVRFALAVEPDLALNWQSDAYVFATTTPEKLTQLQGVSLPVQRDASTLRVCTYNMMGFEGYPESEAALAFDGPNDPRRIEHFRDVFNQLDCDLVGIQEAGSAALMEQLGDALNQHVAVYPSQTIYLGGLVSRYPILENRLFNNPYVSGGPFSRFAGASLVDLEGEPTWIVNLHAYPHNEATRVEEARVLGEQVDSLLETNARVIVLGDFNSPTGEVLHETLTKRGFTNTHEINSKNGIPAIDHIYVSENLKSRVDVGWTVRDPGFALNGLEGPGIWVHSDHVPTVVDLKWR